MQKRGGASDLIQRVYSYINHAFVEKGYMDYKLIITVNLTKGL